MADLFTLLNRISYSLMPYSEKYDFFSCFSPDNQVENNIKFFHRADSLLRTALHTEDNSLVAQMVMYQHIPGEDVFTELRDVFNFSGIPHFEVITPDGKVVKERYITFGLLNSFDYRNFKLEFDKLKEKLEKN